MKFRCKIIKKSWLPIMLGFAIVLAGCSTSTRTDNKNNKETSNTSQTEQNKAGDESKQQKEIPAGNESTPTSNVNQQPDSNNDKAAANNSSSTNNSTTGNETTENSGGNQTPPEPTNNPEPANKSEPANSNDRIVYWTPGGKSYHYDKGCSTLSRSKVIEEGPLSSTPKADPCDKCVR